MLINRKEKGVADGGDGVFKTLTVRLKLRIVKKVKEFNIVLVKGVNYDQE